MTRRRIARDKELAMENACGPDRGGPVMADGVTTSQEPDGPARAGRTLERPARLEEDAVVEAVSAAVLREVEGGTLPVLRIIFGFILSVIR
jgi:hypothetical protein